jgi:predicted nucleic acid-binding protein
LSAVAFDNTMLSVLLNPNNRSQVELAKERAEGVVISLAKARRKIVLPTPACAELLTAIGPTAQQYINTVSRSRVFEVASFDARCAAELALLNRDTFQLHDAKAKLEPYQKIKVDRQIIAICKVYGVSEIYTDDEGLAKRARLCGIVPIGIADIPIPEEERQIRMDLEPHKDLPDAEKDDAA